MAVRQLKQLGSIEKLSLTKIPLVTVKSAQRLANLRVESLWLWCDITRRAMRQVMQLPGLRVLDVLCIKGPGQMGNFRKANDLVEFRCNYCMTEADLMEVTQCAGLREVGAQGAEISDKSIAALLSLPDLSSLDLESTCFNDKMARQLSRSRTIQSLDLGATRITGVGLEHLVQMKQLMAIDLWATDIVENDLQLLLGLPNLEYVSFGNYDSCPQLDSERITEFVLKSSSLKRVWLDGIRLEATQKKDLEEKLDSLRITSLTDAV